MRLTILGNPIQTDRARCRCLNGHGHTFNDPKQTRAMQETRKTLLELWNNRYDDPSNKIVIDEFKDCEAYTLFLSFYFPIAKSESLPIRNLKLWGLIPYTNKPDFDNLAKFYSDCATGIIWSDDKLITFGASHKVKYSDNPRTEMIIIPAMKIDLQNIDQIIFKTFSPVDLREMMLDAISIGEYYEIYKEYFEGDARLPTQSFISETSLRIADFALKFADKLKKIAKQVE